MIVPIPAVVPLIPLTVATDRLSNKSVGNTFAIVENAAYANVAIANNAVMIHNFIVKIVGISSITPNPPKTTIDFLAAPPDQPRLINTPEIHPPKKFPRSAARNGIHTATNPFLSSIPFATRKIGNQSVTKNQTGSVSPFEISVPQVCGSRSKSPHLGSARVPGA